MAFADRVHSKKKTYGYKESKEENRALYLDALSKKSSEHIVYLDESGIDDNDVYPYAWGIKGERIYGIKCADRKKRLSFISALHQGNLFAPFVFEGMCTRKLFEAYVERVLVPSLKPGQTVVMDNASFHKGGSIKQLIENAKCNLLYLTPYSPDLNPIEHFWTKIKNLFRKLLPGYNNDLQEVANIVFAHS